MGVVRRHGEVVGSLGAGLVALPGPGLLVGLCYQASPIGPFCELALLEPARMGARPGWSATLSVVNDARAQSGGRSSWGLPRQLGALVWTADGPTTSLSWREAAVTITARRLRGTWPVLVTMRLVQHRADGRVVVPVRLRALAHRARVEVEAAAGGDLGPVAGRHAGAVLSAQRIRMHPARHPIGLVHTLVAPLHPPEPGVAGPGLVQLGGGDGPTTIAGARAYGSVG